MKNLFLIMLLTAFAVTVQSQSVDFEIPKKVAKKTKSSTKLTFDIDTVKTMDFYFYFENPMDTAKGEYSVINVDSVTCEMDTNYLVSYPYFNYSGGKIYILDSNGQPFFKEAFDEIKLFCFDVIPTVSMLANCGALSFESLVLADYSVYNYSFTPDSNFQHIPMPFYFDNNSIGKFTNQYPFIVRQGKKWGLLLPNGKLAAEIKYDEIKSIGKGVFELYQKNKMVKRIDLKK